MLDGVADRDAEGEEEHLAAGEEDGAEDDVADRPAVLERAEDEHELADDVHGHADDGPQEVNDEEGYGLLEGESELGLEGADGDEEAEPENEEAGYAQELGEGQRVAERREGKEKGRTHSDSGVPSSANWNPTKPFMSRQVNIAATKPVYTAANHCER